METNVHEVGKISQVMNHKICVTILAEESLYKVDRIEA